MMDDKLQKFLMELLQHYCIPGEAAEAFPSWWEQLKEILEEDNQ